MLALWLQLREHSRIVDALSVRLLYGRDLQRITSRLLQHSRWHSRQSESSSSNRKWEDRDRAGRSHLNHVPYLSCRNDVIITGKPPALPGDSQSLTVPGMRSLHRLNRSKLKQTEASVEHLRKPKPLGMGLQVPRGLDTQVPEKGFVWPATRTYGGNSAGIGQAEGE